MTPLVSFQKHIITILFRLLAESPIYLHDLATRCKGLEEGLLPGDRDILVERGLQFPEFPKEAWDTEKACLEIIMEQIDTTGPEIKIRNLLGSPLYYHGPPIGWKEYKERGGGYPSILRTKHVAQPSTLKVGDILGTGEEIISPPREGGNGSVLIHLAGGDRGTWLDVPARIPLALLCEE
ncbi:MAG: hypothetical protein V4697_01825 [Patescibacteria group bacterium]